MSVNYFKDCLYFTAVGLSRAITKLAEESFLPTGLSPTYAFVLMVISEKGTTTPKEISKEVNIAPSTVTRFLDKLENKGLIKRHSEGKNTLVELTDSGIEIQFKIAKSWKDLYDKYVEILGKDFAKEVTEITFDASNKLI